MVPASPTNHSHHQWWRLGTGESSKWVPSFFWGPSPACRVLVCLSSSAHPSLLPDHQPCGFQHQTLKPQPEITLWASDHPWWACFSGPRLRTAHCHRLLHGLVCGLCCAFPLLCLSKLIWSFRKSSSPALVMKPSLILTVAESLFQHLMYSARSGTLHISVSPCKFLEGRNNVSLMFVSPKQRSQCPMQKCSSINVCWLEVWFSLPYPLAFWALLGLSPWQYLKDNFTFWALCSCFICFYDVFIHSSCFMPEAKHFGDISVVRLNVWLFFFFQVKRSSPDVLRVFLWNLLMKKDKSIIESN